MRKIILVIMLASFIPVASASADSFVLGGSYNVMTYQLNGTNYTVGGGSFDVSKLNGEVLPWAYCVDLKNEITLNGSYPDTEVRTDGFVNGALVNNAGQVAWLLDRHAAAAAGTGAMEAALQGLIWEAIYGASFTFLPTVAQNVYFAPWSAETFQSADIDDYLWLTPNSRCYANGAAGCVQGQVTYKQVPEPGSTLLLLGAGLIGLSAWRRRLR